MFSPKRALFAYGSLQLRQVFESVTGCSRQPVPAVLEGYRRTRLQGFAFPAILPDPEASTDGVLYSELDDHAWLRLDAFEDDFYDRISVTVTFAGGEISESDVYVLRDDQAYLSLNVPWSLDDLGGEGLSGLLARVD